MPLRKAKAKKKPLKSEHYFFKRFEFDISSLLNNLHNFVACLSYSASYLIYSIKFEFTYENNNIYYSVNAKVLMGFWGFGVLGCYI